MRIIATDFPGVAQVFLEPRGDHRGYLARTYCEETFGRHGLCTHWVQCNQTLTRSKGAVRGMHWQADPLPEVKLVRCLSGHVFDVVVDVRPDSVTFGQWRSYELSADNNCALYIPAGFAHGFQCLTQDCSLFYMMSAPYVPELARGVRCDDPEIGIAWPIPLCDLSERDMNLPLLAALR